MGVYIKSNGQLQKIGGKYSTINQKIFYGTCDTAANVVAKVITVSADQNFVLTTGCVVYVKFANSNSASSPTLNVNGSGDKSLMYSGTAPYTGSSAAVCGTANYIHQYIYDGTYWVWQGYNTEKDTTYSAMSVAEMNAGTATNSRTIRADRLRSTVETWIDAKIGKSLTSTKTLSPTDPTTYTFTDSSITTDSTIDIYSSIFGVNPTSATVATGSCTVVFPKYSSAVSMICKIYVK